MSKDFEKNKAIGTRKENDVSYIKIIDVFSLPLPSPFNNKKWQ